MIRPVILSGGGGTRLWPLSRGGNPKQFHRLVSEKSLLQATADRCHGTGFLRPLIVTAEAQRFLVIDQLAGIETAPEAVLLEPVPRNTAPAIAAAAHWALARGEDDPMLVMPSDHSIGDTKAFHEAVRAGIESAEDGKLLTFGIRPTGPKTGYGYIRAGGGDQVVRVVERFVEKPNVGLAAELAADESCYWNSGIFLFRPSAYLRELKRHAPDVAERVDAAMRESSTDGLFVRPGIAAFSEATDISIDYAVMEHSDDVMVLPTAFPWSDVGSWDAVHELLPTDALGNVIKGDVLTLDVTNSLIRSEADVTIVAIGLDRVVCVGTHDATFIAPLNRAQDVKRLVDELGARSDDRRDQPAQVLRSWGSYQITDRGERFQTRRIIVNPHSKLSLQKHQHRSEHWVVVKGSAEVKVGDRVHLLQEDESTFIPAGTVHRLANPREVPLHLIEVQCGPDLSEDDIVRLEGDCELD